MSGFHYPFPVSHFQKTYLSGTMTYNARIKSYTEAVVFLNEEV